jgi:hypothetical protein
MQSSLATSPATGRHLWLAFTDHDQRMQWISSVEHVEALGPAVPRQP